MAAGEQECSVVCFERLIDECRVDVVQIDLTRCGFAQCHKGQRKKRSMKCYGGLGVSVKETSVCIVDEAGKICLEVKVPSHPEDLGCGAQRSGAATRAHRLGSGTHVPMAVQRHGGSRIETRHTKAFLKAQ